MVTNLSLVFIMSMVNARVGGVTKTHKPDLKDDRASINKQFLNDTSSDEIAIYFIILCKPPVNQTRR